MTLRKIGSVSIAAGLVMLVLHSAASAAPIAPNGGAAMCAGLTPADFKNAGVPGAAKPRVNVSDPAGAYCVYAGKSSATGGIEFDVFYPAGASAGEAVKTEQTAMSESGSAYTPFKLAGADDARIGLHLVSGGPPFAGVVVRRGTLVFVIGIPAGKNAQVSLRKLAATALARY